MISKLLRLGPRRFRVLSRHMSSGGPSNTDISNYPKVQKHSFDENQSDAIMKGFAEKVEINHANEQISSEVGQELNSRSMTDEQIEKDAKLVTGSDFLANIDEIANNYFTRENDQDLKALIDFISRQTNDKAILMQIIIKLILKLADVRNSRQIFSESIKAIFMISKPFLSQSDERIPPGYVKLSVHLLFFLNRFFPASTETINLFDALANVDWHEFNPLQISTLFYVYLINPALSIKPVLLHNTNNHAYILSKINHFIEQGARATDNYNEVSNQNLFHISSSKFKIFIQAEITEEISKTSLVKPQLLSIIYAFSKSNELQIPFIVAFKKLVQKDSALFRLETDDLCTCLYIFYRHPELDVDNKLTFEILRKITNQRKILEEDSLFVSLLTLRRFADILCQKKTGKDIDESPKIPVSHISEEKINLIRQFYEFCWKTYSQTYHSLAFTTNIKILWEVSHKLKTLPMAVYKDLNINDYLWQKLEQEGDKLSFYDLLTFGFIVKRYFYIDHQSLGHWEYFLQLMSKHLSNHVQEKQKQRAEQVIENLIFFTEKKGLQYNQNRVIFELFKRFQKKYLKDNKL